MEIARIKELLKERESSEEESSSPADDLSPGSRDPTDTTQDEDVEMKDIKDDSHLPQGTGTQTDPPTEETEDELGAVGHIDLMTPGGDQPLLEGGGATPIAPKDDKILDYQEEEENQAGAITPSGAVAESLSQINIDSPVPTPPTNAPLEVTRRLEEPIRTPERKSSTGFEHYEVI